MVNQRFQSDRTLTLQKFGRPLPNLNILTRVTYLTTFSILLGFFIVLVAILSQKLLDFFNYQFQANLKSKNAEIPVLTKLP